MELTKEGKFSIWDGADLTPLVAAYIERWQKDISHRMRGSLPNDCKPDRTEADGKDGVSDLPVFQASIEDVEAGLSGLRNDPLIEYAAHILKIEPYFIYEQLASAIRQGKRVA